MSQISFVSLLGVDRALVTRSLDYRDGDVIDLPEGSIIELEDFALNQDCTFQRTASGWRQIYSASWP